MNYNHDTSTLSLRWLAWLAVTTCAVWLGTAHAAGPATNSGVGGALPYQRIGTVNYISTLKNSIVIDDNDCLAPSNIKVHSGRNVLSISSVTKGMKVGYNTTISKGRPVITEMWILPRTTNTR